MINRSCTYQFISELLVPGHIEAFSDVQPGATTPLEADISQFESSMRFPS